MKSFAWFVCKSIVSRDTVMLKIDSIAKQFETVLK